MTIWVDDISRYDGGPDALTADRCDEAIFNVEDPQVLEKVRRWSGELDKPWHLYGWEYPGGGSSAIPLIHDTADRLDMTPKAGWVDYEQNGVTADDGWAAHAAADELGFPCGFYTYLYLLNSQAGLRDVWRAFNLRWIAYYPGTNDGSYPAAAIDDAQQWGSVLWQYTSSNGTRDRNVVVDEARWATLGAAPAPPPAPPAKKGQHMELVMSPTRSLTHLAGVLDVIVEVPGSTQRTPEQFGALPVNATGILAANPKIQISRVGEETYDRVLAKLQGESPPPAPSQDLSEVIAAKKAFDAAFSRAGLG